MSTPGAEEFERVTGATGIPDGLRDGVRAAWHGYLDALLPLRGELYRYTRELTHSPWAAEDLVQETLLLGFGRLALVHYPIEDRALYLMRCASEAWLSGRQTARRGEPADPSALRSATRVLRELRASGSHIDAGVIAQLAAWLEPRPAADPEASEELVDRFVSAYNARDLPKLLDMILVDGAVEMVGNLVEIGRQVLAQAGGWFDRVLFGHPEWPPALQFEAPRVERVRIDGELLAVGFTTRFGEEAMESVLRFEERAGHISRVRYYVFCPEVVREVAATLGYRARTGLYRYPTRAPGVAWADPE